VNLQPRFDELLSCRSGLPISQQMSASGKLEALWAEIQKDPSHFIGLVTTLIIIIVVRIAVRRYVLHKQPPKLTGTLKSIHVYPIKSCKGLSPTKWTINKYGLEHDREWMIIDSETNRFQTQRQHPKMALIAPTLKEENSQQFLFVDYPGMPTLKIPMSGKDQKQQPRRIVAVWDAPPSEAVDEGDEAAAWFQKVLNKEGIRLVRVPSNNSRTPPPQYQVEKALNHMNFNDAFSFLLTSESSLADLNKRMAEASQSKALPMNRFRPNLVIGGVPAFAEDNFKRFKIGDIVFYSVKKCTRCKLTTVDQNTGSFDGQEPLQTLKTFRKGLLQGGEEVCFGENLIHAGMGTVQVGQRFVLLESKV